MTDAMAGRRRRSTRLGARGAQGGYVLLFVVAALALMAFGVGRYAARVEILQAEARQLLDEAQGRIRASNALARTQYWLSTRPMGFASSGFADEAPLQMDGRLYRSAEGVLVQVLDDRALLSINAADRDLMMPVLMSLGASADEAARMVAVLQDYVDEDDLRRLNGAERADYAELGLPPPANSWFTDIRELRRLPVWRDKPELLDRLMPWLGLRPERYLNPNTAPLPLLQALWPRIGSEQWAIFDSLRRRQPFVSVLAAKAASGIPFDDEHYVCHVMATLRVRLWTEGLPQALEYNLSLLPEGPRAPWLVRSVALGPPLHPTDSPATPIENLPVPSAATAITEPVPTAAP
ncbi:MAG TPA: hypothetical protein VK195_18840 [Burkholderiaceae bacterium]|nr:hypothetical protein [Burkholderiaceae bacterium]